ncbi:MAG: alanine--tRNA ligase [Balneolaceae bacterium]|nr:MAG: alanine--tRNA ligase [Balneolaceae bacterium]
MPVKTASQIRQEFFDFFREKEHLIVPSVPVVPKDDPTLLFINAGMNPFKPVFLGEQEGVSEEGRVWKRVANTQKCIRVSGKHNDLEEVGHDTYHHTLFEMLGNWSFGDYFKKEAIAWAWELLVDRWGLEPDRLYATVFEGDDADGLPVDEEAASLWASETSINPDHILTFGKKDNFWEMGDTGPCGPCSEVHIDLRSDEERKKKPGAELVNTGDARVMEIWNLVFIQFNRLSDGSLNPLPAKHVDTGMGFERIAAVIQRKTSNYDTDIFTPVISRLSELTGTRYGADPEKDIAKRVIADHIRAVTFSIADGASPSNDGRGYVIRRILRRAVRYGYDKLGFREPFMYKLVPVLSGQFRDVFPELDKQQDYVSGVIRAEEAGFLRTLGQGIQLFENMIEGKKQLSGEDAFKLHDTYGFPIDLTRLMASEKGLTVDEAGFEERMQEQKQRARSAGRFTADVAGKADWVPVTAGNDSVFVGYNNLQADTRIHSIRKQGDSFALLLDQTPFYAESGGQIADTGIITNGDEHIRVLDVRKADGRSVHIVDRIPEDPSGSWQAMVDADRRTEIQKNHTATHLMHAALRRVLGSHVQQKGSLVEPGRLRFDFSHYEGMTGQELDRVEKMVNERIQENIPFVEERDVPIDEARERGAMMLFGEKYGEKVRMVIFDPAFSVELCGGTHVQATGEIGYFRFLHEASAAAGIRRVEALTGEAVDQHLRGEKATLHQIREQLGQTIDMAGDIRKMIEEKKALEKEVERMRLQSSMQQLDSLLASARNLNGGVALVTGQIAGADMNQLKQLGYESLKKKPSGHVVVLGSRDDASGKVYLVTTVTDDLIREKGLKAGSIVGQVARLVGGGGGGQPNLATAGGREPGKLDQALLQVNEIVKGFFKPE